MRLMYLFLFVTLYFQTCLHKHAMQADTVYLKLSKIRFQIPLEMSRGLLKPRYCAKHEYTTPAFQNGWIQFVLE